MFTKEELQFLTQAAQAAQIQGRHAALVAGVIEKLSTLAEDQKETGNADTD